MLQEFLKADENGIIWIYRYTQKMNINHLNYIGIYVHVHICTYACVYIYVHMYIREFII